MSTRLERISGEAKTGVFTGLSRAIGNRAVGVQQTADPVLNIPLEQIDEDPDNARRHFNQESLEALAEGLKRHGQIANATVWRDQATGRYVLVAGHRRLRACRIAGIPTLICVVLPRDTAQELKAEIAFAENVAREDLKPIEVARHWKKLMERWQISGSELARRLGVSQSTVSKRMALLKTDDATQAALETGKVAADVVYRGNAQRRSRGAGKRRSTFVEFDTRNGKGRLKRSGTLEGLIADLQALARDQAREAA